MKATRPSAADALPVDALTISEHHLKRPTGCSRRENVVWMPGDGPPVDQVPRLPSTLAIAVMVFQLRVVTGTPKSRSNVPR
jgi:hypothetical protein